MAGIVLDASAILALLKGEPGADKVAGVLDQAVVSIVNYAEVVSHYAKGGSPRERIEEMLDALPITVVPVDKELGAQAGMLRPVTASAGLSPGDRFCLALAIQTGLPAWTADREWKSIERAVGAKVVVIR